MPMSSTPSCIISITFFAFILGVSLVAEELSPKTPENYPDELIDCLELGEAHGQQELIAALDELAEIKAPQYVIDSLVAWPTGKPVRVGFFGGNETLWAKVESVAKEWEKWANISFTFRDSSNNKFHVTEMGKALDADIRIGFVIKGKGSGNWSLLGKNAARTSHNERSMNLGEPAAYPNGPRFTRVVLHEFGHALGFQHEHKHPVDKCDINMEQAIKHFAGPPNGWPPEKTRAQLIALKPARGLILSGRDSESIMHYHLPKECFNSKEKSPCYVAEARSLSLLDKKGAGLAYPKTSGPGYDDSILPELQSLVKNERLSERTRKVLQRELDTLVIREQ
jgi:hypothetical protein